MTKKNKEYSLEFLSIIAKTQQQILKFLLNKELHKSECKLITAKNKLKGSLLWLIYYLIFLTLYILDIVSIKIFYILGLFILGSILIEIQGRV